jgi:carboxyl-terminal processing protease
VPKDAKPYQFKLAVLVNEKTASASEILSGALQDHDRAIIVGVPSYGKGLVQSVLPLSDGAGMAITSAFYYTPSGRSIQHPLRNSALSTTFSKESNAQLPKYKTDKGRTVTGGGGILPDIQVQPPEFTRLQNVLDASGSFTAFATQYLANHSPLPANFEVGADVLDEFKVFLAGRNIQPGIGEWGSLRVWLTSRLKEDLITQAYGVAKGDEIRAQRDPQVQAALKAIQSSGKDSILAQAR